MTNRPKIDGIYRHNRTGEPCVVRAISDLHVICDRGRVYTRDSFATLFMGL